jgi:hypothetical protein
MKKIILLAISFLSISIGSNAQNKKSEERQAVKEAINKQRFVFKAQSVSPASGNIRQLTSEYDVRITKDSVISFLPYFGRAFTAPLPGAEGGIKFTSTKFHYNAEGPKKGSWDISIKPNDVYDTREMILTISENGYGNLQVMSNNRQPISFYGYVEAIK